VAVLGSQRLRHVDGTIVRHRYAPAVIDFSSWTFAGADMDQGFLVTMLLVRHDIARYTKLTGCSKSKCMMYKAQHYAGGGGIRKPWQKALKLSAALQTQDRAHINLESGETGKYRDFPLCPLFHYVSRLHIANVSAGSCARTLREARSGMESRLQEVRLRLPFPACLRYVTHQCKLPAAKAWAFALF